MTGSVFRYAIADLITPVFDPVDELFVFANIESIHSTGVETELEGRTANGWTGRAGYSVQQTREQPGDLSLTNSPRHMAKVSAIVPLLDGKLFAGAEGFYVSSRRTLMDSQADGFFLTNLTLSTSSLLSGWDGRVALGVQPVRPTIRRPRLVRASAGCHPVGRAELPGEADLQLRIPVDRTRSAHVPCLMEDRVKSLRRMLRVSVRAVSLVAVAWGEVVGREDIASVVILSSGDSTPYREVVKGFQRYVEQHRPSARVDLYTLSDGDRDQALDRIRRAPPRCS